MARLSGAESAEMKDYEAEGDLRTLVQAEKIKADKPRFKRAMAKHKEMMAAMQKIGG